MMVFEHSSPLAAIQPSHLQRPWGQLRDRPEFDNGFLRPQRPQGGFNFKDMSMNQPIKKSNSDYFSFKPARGSSPTQSLAVDLSQNFHIDQSPQLPTPRRSLFTTTLVKDRNQTVVTPPVPSSSPGPDNDPMELSPLPHKQPPRTTVIELPSCSATSEAVPETDTPAPLPRLRRSDSEPEEMPQAKPAEDRKMFNPMRPGIRKGLSSNNVPTRRPRTSESSRPFFFGAASTALKAPLESFAESPPSERKLPPSISHPSLIEPLNAPLNGSPIANPQPRRPTMSRHRSGISRRTMSMQYNDSSRAMRAEKRCCTTGSIQASLLSRDEHVLKLPHFKTIDEIDGLPRITKDTFVNVLEGKYAQEVGDIAVIDCRFEYEYLGGHISGALNFNDKEEMAGKLFEDSVLNSRTLVFHCEYSAHRAPIMAKYIRQRDRAVNQNAYPRLTYPEVYILDGGYKGFYSAHSDKCVGSYIEMDSKEHEEACEMGMAKVKRRAKLSRAQTYACGQSSASFQASPLPSIPSIPSGHPLTQSPVDMMDIDFTSPVEIKVEPPMDHAHHPFRLHSY